MPTKTKTLPTTSRSRRPAVRRTKIREQRPTSLSSKRLMTSPEAQRSLIDDIDDRQEALLSELEALNARVEQLLDECLASRDRERLAEAGDNAETTPADPGAPISQWPATASALQEC